MLHKARGKSLEKITNTFSEKSKKSTTKNQKNQENMKKKSKRLVKKSVKNQQQNQKTKKKSKKSRTEFFRVIYPSIQRSMGSLDISFEQQEF